MESAETVRHRNYYFSKRAANCFKETAPSQRLLRKPILSWQTCLREPRTARCTSSRRLAFRCSDRNHRMFFRDAKCQLSRIRDGKSRKLHRWHSVRKKGTLYGNRKLIWKICCFGLWYRWWSGTYSGKLGRQAKRNTDESRRAQRPRTSRRAFRKGKEVANWARED